MSVFTWLNEAGLSEILSQYPSLSNGHIEPIESGTVNSNFWLTTDEGQYVLTLFESLDAAHTEQYLRFQDELASHYNFPTARAVPTTSGEFVGHFYDKPVSIVEKLPGAPVTVPNEAQLKAMGQLLGQLHTTRLGRINFDAPMGFHWRQQYAQIAGKKNPRIWAKRFKKALSIDEQIPYSEFPSGVIHSDLFRDNVLFEGDEVTGLIDFYYAGIGPLIVDLAIAINEWARIPGEPAIDAQALAVFMDAYEQERPLEEIELDHLNEVCTVMAWHFWVSRLLDIDRCTDHDTPVQLKDYREYARLTQHWLGL